MQGDNLRLQEVLDHARDDREYQDLLQLVKTGFPAHKGDLPLHLKQFWYIADCKLCQDSLPSHPREPIVTKPRPSRPFQQMAMDFAYHACQYFLVVVDCLTDWPLICPMGTNTTSSCTINVLRGLFCRTAAPDIVWSDGGPQFTSGKFQSFLKSWGVRHEISSPHYPQSNGKADATIKSMKQLIKAAWKRRFVDQDVLARALLQYRNTPCRRDGLSPAQKLYGHPPST